MAKKKYFIFAFILLLFVSKTYCQSLNLKVKAENDDKTKVIDSIGHKTSFESEEFFVLIYSLLLLVQTHLSKYFARGCLLLKMGGCFQTQIVFQGQERSRKIMTNCGGLKCYG